jgi:hypothetical protein
MLSPSTYNDLCGTIGAVTRRCRKLRTELGYAFSDNTPGVRALARGIDCLAKAWTKIDARYRDRYPDGQRFYHAEVELLTPDYLWDNQVDTLCGDGVDLGIAWHEDLDQWPAELESAGNAFLEAERLLRASYYKTKEGMRREAMEARQDGMLDTMVDAMADEGHPCKPELLPITPDQLPPID